MLCFEGSSPNRRGYMCRMHALWVEKHPQLQFAQQRLRDYVSYLRKRGYTPLEIPPEEPVQAPPPPQESVPSMEIRASEHSMEELRTRRRKISKKIFLKPEHLARMDRALKDQLPEDVDLLQLNGAVYHAALSVLDSQPRAQAQADKVSRRIGQLVGKVDLARKHASRIQCVMDYMTSGRPFTSKIRRLVNRVKRQHHTLNKSVLLTIKQHCVNRIRALMSAKQTLVRRLRRIKDNNTFRLCPSRLLEKPVQKAGDSPGVRQVEEFWKDIYEKPAPFNSETPALELFATLCRRVQHQDEECPAISTEEVKRISKGMKNFSAPGPDGINAYWWKNLPVTHSHLSRIFTAFICDQTPLPGWLVEGRTVLIPKKGNLSDPRNYRPITCLNVCYKIFTKILSERILQKIQPVWRQIGEQRGTKRGVEGCRENLLIDRCITQDSVQYKRNLSMAWIDYSKAFDTTSHNLLVYLLECLAVHENIVRCIQHLLPLWRTRFAITTGKKTVSTELVTYRRGVFQGDSLSPLLFCISLLPLSVALQRTRGYSCGTPGNRKHKVTHLLYMDDLKIYATSKSDLQLAVGVVQRYTRDIGMSFGLDKCAVLHLSKGRSAGLEEDMQLVDGSVIKHLDAGETYRYLGIDENRVQDAGKIKESLRSKYKWALRQIWSTELSGKNKVSATNMLAVPILTYAFGVMKWTVNELQDLDRVTRKRMHLERSIHPRSSVPRVYLSRNLGGRGLLSLESLHDRVVLGVACKLIRSSDPLLRLVHDHEVAGKGAFLYSAARRAAERFGLDFDVDGGGLTNVELPRVQAIVKAAEQRYLLMQHREKPMHGVFYQHVDQHGLSRELTFAFLKSAGLKSETEGFILACQDGVINTLAYRRNVMRMNIPDVNCRACHTAPETLMHLLAACPVQAVSGYIHRHNAALRVLYYHLRHSYGIDRTPVLPYAPGDIESVVENDKCRVYWNYSFETTRLLSATKPDIVLFDFAAKVIYVIEFSAPAERNISIKEEDKRAKYQELLQELRKLHRGYSVKLVVLIIGVLGGMKPTLVTNLKIIPACVEFANSIAGRMQKAVILGSLRLLRGNDLESGLS